jgi:tetratricopeptide (TPR) repeat protein
MVGDKVAETVLHAQSLAVVRSIGDPALLASVLFESSSNAIGEEGVSVQSIIEWLQEALTLYQSMGDRAGSAMVLTLLGADVYKEYGFYTEARGALTRALALWGDLHEQDHLAMVREGLGDVALYQGNLDDAVALYQESLDYWRSINHPHGQQNVANLGRVALAQNDLERAAQLFITSRELEPGTSHTIVTMAGSSWLAEVHSRQGDYHKAHLLYQESLTAHMRLQSRGATVGALEGIARCMLGLENPAQAARLWGATEALRERLGMPIPPVWLPQHQRIITLGQTQLKPTAFEEAWAAGRNLTLEQVVIEAQEYLSVQRGVEGS